MEATPRHIYIAKRWNVSIPLPVKCTYGHSYEQVYNKLMNIYISKKNEDWLRVQGTSMSGIINRLLDEARAGKHGPHVIAQYETLDEALRSDEVRPVPYELKLKPPVVKTSGGLVKDEGKLPSHYTPSTPVNKELEDKIQLRQAQKDLQFCKHGQVKGLCKKGCK